MGEFKAKLDKIVERFRGEITSLRTGRATPALIEDVAVEYYGTKTPLKAMAAISAPEARQLIVKPWDKAALPLIEKAIVAASLGLSPVTEQETIRLSIPALTQERRRELVRMLGKTSEEARIHLRRERDETLKEVERAFRAKEMGEDEWLRRKKDVQKTVDEVNQKIEAAAAAKEKEIMTV